MGTYGPQSTFIRCEFKNCDFKGADWTGAFFDHCKFENCDFEGADWTGAFLDTPNFDQCDGITFELCRNAKLKDPSGLSSDVLEQLRSQGLL